MKRSRYKLIKSQDYSMESRIVHLFWTGGLDSTYRMVELSRKDCVIQPHYIITSRKTVGQELRAMAKILSILQSDKRTIATIQPLEIFSKGDLEDYPDIQSAYMQLYEEKNFKSGQYRLLARYARQKELKLEIGLQFSENGSVVKVIDESVLMDCPDNSDVMIIDPVKGSHEWASFTLFHDFLFPKSLYHKTKIEEIEELKKLGYDKVLKNVWSCLSPVLGMPCGHCLPCRSALQEGAGMMVPFVGYILGGIRLYYRKTLRLSKNKLKRILPQRLYELYKLLRYQVIVLLIVSH